MTQGNQMSYTQHTDRLSTRWQRDLKTMVWSLLLLASALAAPAGAQTSVSGAVDVDTAWTISGSPYTVTDDLIVGAGATLTIEPGVTVQVASDANLTIENGSLVAIGLADERIVITSWRDDGLETTPAEPGDWGSLVFLDGTVDATSMLVNVDVRFGEGVLVESASPTFNNVALDHHAAPAMRIDLASSPKGVGLTGEGNELNGISVPPGAIEGDVVWALRGLPYVVQQGSVAIGTAAFEFTPDLVTLAANAEAELVLSIPEPAPVGGLTISLQSSNPNDVEVAGNVHVAQGETSASVTVTARSLGSRTAISAVHSTLGEAVAEVRVIDLPPLLLLPPQAVIGIEAEQTFTVSLVEPAPEGGISVAFETSGAVLYEIPDLIIPEGHVSGALAFRGRQAGLTTVIARADGYVSTSASIEVKERFVVLPGSFIIAPGTTRTLAVQLSEPAPAGGVTLAITQLGDDIIGPLPATLFIPQGQTTFPVAIYGQEGSSGTIELLISDPLSNFESGTTDIVVDDFTLEFEVEIDELPEAFWEETRIVLSQAAPAGGLLVSVESANPAIVSINRATVFIPEGQLKSTTVVRLSGVQQGGTSLAAIADGVSNAEMQVDVLGPLRIVLSRGSVTVGAGLTSHLNEVTVSLRTGSGSGYNYYSKRALSIALANPHATQFDVPLQLDVPVSSTPPRFRIKGLSTTTSPVDLEFSPMNFQGTPATLSVSVVEPLLVFGSLAGSRHESSPRDDFYVSWGVTASSYPQTSNVNQVISLSLVDRTPSDIVEGLYDSIGGPTTISSTIIAANQDRSPTLYIGAPTASIGEYRVAASSSITSTATSALQQVGGYQLAIIAMPAAKFGKGVQHPCTLRVERRIGSEPTYGHPLTVVIESSSAGFVSVVSTIEFTTGQTTKCLPVEGLELTPTPISLTASVMDPASPIYGPASVDFEVVEPRLSVISPTTIYTDLERSSFYVGTIVNRTEEDYEEVMLSDNAAIDFQIQDADPVGFLIDLYEEQSGGSPITFTQIASGSGWTNDLFIGVPGSVGSFRIRATSAGFVTGISEEIQSVKRRIVLLGNSSDGALYIGRGLGGTVEVTHNPQLCRPWPNEISVVSSHPEIVRVIPQTTMNSASTTSAGDATKGCSYQQSVELEALAIPGPGIDVHLVAESDDMESSEPLAVHVVEPILSIEELDNVRTQNDERDAFGVSFRVPVVGMQSVDYPYGYPIEATEVEIAVTDQVPTGIVDGIYADYKEEIPVTSLWTSPYSGAWGLVGVPQMASGAYVVTASVDGYAPATSIQQVVQPATVQFSHGKTYVGEGLVSAANELTVQHVVGGRPVPASEDIVVLLRCASADVCSVAPSAVIPKGLTSVEVPVTGTRSGSTSLVLGRTPGIKEDDSQVFVVPPQLRFNERMTDAGTPEFSVGNYVWHARTPFQAVALPMDVDLRVTPRTSARTELGVRIEPGSIHSPFVRFERLRDGDVTLTASAPGALPASVEPTVR